MGRRTSKRIRSGVGQLTLVEHALCSMDSRISLVPNYEHRTEFSFTDKARKRRTARVRVYCPLGLSPSDDLIIWGLLALTLANDENGGELHATRHYLMRQLGLIDPQSRRGGRQYKEFTAALDRIAAAKYFSDNFYDPIMAEHRRINFGFFSTSLPADLNSNRAWRITWDTSFFKFAQASSGAMRFHLDVFRDLDPASRRLYLFASKILRRQEVSHSLSVSDVVANVLGYSSDLTVSAQNARLRHCLRRLILAGVLRPGETRLYKRAKKRYSFVMARGNLLRRKANLEMVESPLLEPLCDIGFDSRDATRIVSKFPTPLVREWVDITLAARERFGMQFFKRSPMAYLRYNLNKAAKGTNGPPDWWYEVRKAEEHALAERARKKRSTQSPDQLPTKAMDSLDNVRESIFDQFLAAGQSKKQASENAKRFAKAKRNR